MNRQQLIEDNMTLVYSVLNKHYPTFAKDEDIVQAGMLGLCRAASTWDEEKSQFSTYAYHCIMNTIRTELRNRNKHSANLSLDYTVSADDGGITTFGDLIIGETDVDYIDWDGINEQLTPRDKQIFELKQSGLSTREIATTTGLHPEVVRVSIRKIRRILNN